MIELSDWIERKCHDENVFPKADEAISKLNFIFYLKSKPNLVVFW